ncbi:MAG: acyltransferase [Calditrichaeota bacterium]|nr:acyltransferase [Calditrichota bacterium]
MWKVGYFQFRPLFGQVERNVERVVHALRDVEADLIVLPELPFTGYFFRDRQEALDLAEDPEDSPTLQVLIALCKGRNFHLVTGFAEKRGNRCYNSAILIGPDGVRHIYRKLHLFHEEKHWFDPGDRPLAVTEVHGVRIGMMICFDWIFPEAMRTLAVLGADIVCHPSNLVLSYCQQTMLSRCLENGVFAITANRIGVDRRPHGSIRFTGKSQIVAPRGELRHRGPSRKEELYITSIDPLEARDKQFTPLNHLMNDRRPEFYRPLVESNPSGSSGATRASD